MIDENFVWRWVTIVVMMLAIAWLIAPAGNDAETVTPTFVTYLATTSTSSTSTSSSSTSTSSTSTTSSIVPADFVPQCSHDLLALAAEVGWPAAELPKLDTIAWRESRCAGDAQNLADPGDFGSIGVLQINSAAWCLPTKWYPSGYLQHIGLLDDCNDLFDTRTNLAAGLVVWSRSGWQAWSTA